MFSLGVTKLYAQPNEQQNGASENQTQTSTTEVSSIPVTENGSATNTQSSEVDVVNEKDEPIIPETKPDAVPESALEQLANQPETISKYNDMTNDVKEMDMIAFKVFTPSFEQSNYVIGLVEEIIGRTTVDQQDYDLVLQIMGENTILLDFSFSISSWISLKYYFVVHFQLDTATSNTCEIQQRAMTETFTFKSIEWIFSMQRL